MEFVSLPAAEDLPPLDAWYPWPADRPWLRCMMVMSLDGGFRGADGRSRGISSPADQRVLLQGRRLAHAVLIGAETMRRERYQALRCGNDVVRRESGLPPEPTLVVVSASLDLPWDEGALADSEARPLVATTEQSLDRALREGMHPGRSADVIALPGHRVDMGQLLAALHSRGLVHLVCEGGPHLLSELVQAQAVDEADITLSPLLTGGGHIATRPAMPEPTGLRLAAVLEHRDWLFTRYVRDGN